ncbi:hypothetical protein Vadar_032498 [Vaccinium darrowii]|uniref:Uncharacterized protein n=1 Tax=Vaccinium darrowii TaxID=229202 RepID=A0ACB7ZNA5_9ERIC|nr:hypothetical protein Vadar_032498 [Vaccinium darrowii]
MTKSVAEEISEKLCESVAASLEAKKLASFTKISSTVQGLDDDAALQVRKLYEELVELWPDASIELNALYVEQKIGRGHCTAGMRSQYELNDPQDLYIMILTHIWIPISLHYPPCATKKLQVEMNHVSTRGCIR